MHKKSKSNIKTNDGNFALCCVDRLAKKIFRHAPRLPDFGNSARCPIMNERFQIVEWFKVTFFLMSSDFQLFCRYFFRHAPRLPDFGNSARCPIMNERFQIVEWFKVTFFLMSSDFQLFCRYLSN